MVRVDSVTEDPIGLDERRHIFDEGDLAEDEVHHMKSTVTEGELGFAAIKIRPADCTFEAPSNIMRKK